MSGSGRLVGILALILIGAALGSRLLDPEHAAGAAIKVVSATLAVLVVPGALATVAVRPRPQLTVLEVIGFGIGVSFGLVQLLTMLAMMVHVSVALTISILVTASVLMAACVVWRAPGPVVVTRDELITLAVILAAAVFLYALGSPFTSSEDQMHAATIRRLTSLAAPRLDNAFFLPGTVNTYPFPGTHYSMAMIARLADIDPLFVYHKLRFFWGPAALTMLYLAGRLVFGAAGIASAVAITAAIFVGAGVFAMVPGFSWGWSQLAPYSHPSDVAMTVLLPALLVVAFAYLVSGSVWERRFFLVATAALCLMLTAVHVREAVQFIVYSGSFLIVTMAVRAFRPYMRRAALLTVIAVAVALAYASWLAGTGARYADVLDEQRANVLSVVDAAPLRTLVLEPASNVVANYLPEFEHIWDGLTPFVLFAGPAAIVLFRRLPLVWLVAASTIAYLALMSVPLLAVPYIYFTYYEILYTPVRNIAFFLYLLAGAALYSLVVALAAIDRTRLTVLAAGTLGGVLAVLTMLTVNRSHVGFFMPLIAAYALTLVFFGRSGTVCRPSWRTAVALTVSLVALLALWPERSPVPRSEQVAIRWSPGLSEARRVSVENELSLREGEARSDSTDEVNVWNYRLMDLSVDNVKRIVAHPDVRDTHFIDRATFTVQPQPPPGEHQPLAVIHVPWLRYPGWPSIIVAALAVWALAFLVPVALASEAGARAAASVETAINQPFHRHAIPFALFMTPFVLCLARPTLSPLPLLTDRAPAVSTPQAMIAQLPCVATPDAPLALREQVVPEGVRVPARKNCPPVPAVIEWIQTRVAVDAVFAIDLWNPYMLSVFTPQQVVAMPLIETAASDPKMIFNDHYSPFFDARMRRYRVQPFFNAVETTEERAEFVEGLGVTHVLVDPAYYDELRPVLDSLSAQYVLRFTHEKWAVYEVVG